MSDVQGIAKQVAGSIHRKKSVCFFLGSGAAIDSSLDQDLQKLSENSIFQEIF
jgi:hypothetical protein